MLCSQTTQTVSVLAPAKLNLFLRVVERRSDGFHNIESVIASVNLYDTLTFSNESSGHLELVIQNGSSRTATGLLRLEAPSGPENLVLRAANALRKFSGITNGAKISLIKRIPSSAGLGGGSSDAAATLVALNRLWNLKINRQDLVEIAATLGSDVPFFLAETPMALCTGRGERIAPLPIHRSMHFVIVKPTSGLSTPAVYRACTPDRVCHPVESFSKALASGSTETIARHLHNGLQVPAESLNPEVTRLRHLFERLPVIGHQMSGSGSSYFGICASRVHAEFVAGRLRSSRVPWVCVARTCP